MQLAPETPSIEIETPIMFFDTDAGGIVHNLAYLRFIETARTLFAEQLGMNLAAMAKEGEFVVLVRTEIDYKQKAAFGDSLLIRGELASVGRMRFWCAFRVHRKSDECLVAESRQMLAMIRMPSGRPIPIPAELRERYPHLTSRMSRSAG